MSISLIDIEQEIKRRHIEKWQIADIISNYSDAFIIAGYCSVSITDREGHMITIPALKKAVDKFMENPKYRDLNIFHSDVQIGEILPQWIHPETGKVYKTMVDQYGWHVVCLTPETEIRTSVGYKQIKDIVIGDKVYTHLCGKSFPVTDVMQRQISEEITVLYLGGNNVIRVTKEHPILTKNGWKKAGNIERGDILLHIEETHIPTQIVNGTVVKCVSNEFYVGTVYNLSVDKAESYSGHGIIFHNCKLRGDIEIAKKVRDEVEKGNIRSFSIAGTATDKTHDYNPFNPHENINDLEIYEVTCLLGNTKIVVNTKYGFKNIANINIGEEVLTHNNRFRKVIHKFERDVSEDIIKLTLENNKTISLTANHPVFIMRSGEESWIPAGEINYLDRVIYKSICEEISKIERIKHVGKVYNLEVEEDNSYTTDACIVHNCCIDGVNQLSKFSVVYNK